MSTSRTRSQNIPASSQAPEPPARIVLVDDRAENLMALESALGGLGELLPARSGERALEYLLESDCACVLMDVRMPGLDGFETARLIRERRATRYVPIIFITGMDPDPEETARGYALGAVDFITKPFNPAALRAKVSFFVDLFQRSREARRSRERYDALSEIAPVGIFYADPAGDCLWVNPIWCEISGLSPAEALGKGWSTSIHPGDRPRVFEEWYRAAQTGATFRSEYRFIRPDGRETWVLGQAKAERDEAGRVRGYVGTVTDITDRHRAEELTKGAKETLEREVADRTDDLSRRKEHLRLILEGSLDAVVAMDGEGLITTWNAQAERMFGWPASEIVGKPLVDILIPPRFRQAHQRGMAHLRATGEGPILGKRIDTFALRRDGTEFPIELAVTPLRNGIESSFSAFIRDLTERRRGEAVSELLAAVVRSSPDPVMTKSLDGTITSWNEAAERTFGYAAAEMLGRSITTLIPEHLLEAERAILEKVSRGERLDPFETLRRRKDGALIDVSVTISPLRDHEGRIVGASKILRDITDRKRAEERARFLTQAAEVLASSLDYEGTLARVADFAARSPLSDWCTVFVKEHGTIRRVAVAHRDPNKLEWARAYERRFPFDIQLHRPILEVVETGRPWMAPDITDDFLRASVPDEPRFLAIKEAGIRSAMVVPLTAGGRVIGALSLVSAESRRTYTAVDLSLAEALAERAAIAFENARLYRASRDLNATLEERIQQRTAELTAAVQELEAFSYTVAHDLRAPLRAMAGLSRVLSEDHIGKTDAAGQDYARRILDAGRRMDDMVQDLLDYSRLARQEITLEEVDLDGLIREILGAMSGELQERGADVKIDGALPWVVAHRAALTQAVTNLVQNASKFVLPGRPPRVRISAAGNAGWIVLSIKDDGIGIAPEHHERIFGVFQRLHGEAKYPGTGIGLAIVRKAMERMGGRAGVESDLGKGSRFWLELKRGKNA
jgi:PAS domain S-box-containing protein